MKINREIKLMGKKSIFQKGSRWGRCPLGCGHTEATLGPPPAPRVPDLAAKVPPVSPGRLRERCRAPGGGLGGQWLGAAARGPQGRAGAR